MADETVKLILELENKAKKDFDNLNKELKELKKEAKGAGKEVDDLGKDLDKTGKEAKEAGKEIGNAGKETGKLSKGFSTAAKGAGALAVAATAVAAALGAVVSNSVSLNRELNQLATLSGLGFENFQLLAAQAQEFGLSSDQVADAVNNINLRIQEAATLGSGAGIDVFKIIGEDASELARLDIPEQLERIRAGFQNLDQQQARFFADELGSDAAIQLLSLENINFELDKIRNGGQIEILSDEESQKIKELEAEIAGISRRFDLLKLQLTSDISETLVETLRDLRNLIDTISDSVAFEAATRFVNVLRTLITTVSRFAVSLGSIVGDFVFFLGNQIPAGFNNLILTINNLSSSIGLELFSKEFVTEVEENLAVLENAADKRLSSIADTAVEEFDRIRNAGAFQALQFSGLSGEERQLLQRALEGNLETIREIERAVALTNREFEGLVNTATRNQLLESIENNRIRIRTEADLESAKKTGEDISKEVEKNVKPQIGIPTTFLETLRTAQVQSLRLQGAFEQAFEVENTERLELLEKAKEALEIYKDEIRELRGFENATGIATIYDVQIDDLEKLIALERQRAQLQQAEFDRDQLFQRVELGLINENEFNEKIEELKQTVIENFGEGTLAAARFIDELERANLAREQAVLSDVSREQGIVEQQFRLGLIGEEEFIEKLQLIRGILAETFGEESVELNAFDQQLNKTIATLDTFGQISLQVFEEFSAGFAQAATDALLSGASLRDGLGNVFASIAQQLLQAALQALIFSAIISSFSGTSLGNTLNPQGLSFGQLFQQNLGANLGVPLRHNGGSVDPRGDANNSIKNINLADPASSLNPNERFIIAKTDESIVKTSSLNSPTGIGSNQPTQPEVKINNYITDDVLNAFLTSDAAQDTIVNIVNNNNDRIR